MYEAYEIKLQVLCMKISNMIKQQYNVNIPVINIRMAIELSSDRQDAERRVSVQETALWSRYGLSEN